jgi:small subunit ribosomal protein S16
MLKIRLKRIGRKKRPCYKIVVMNSLWRRDGKAIAEIGQYDPFQKRLHVEKKELVKFIKNGAYPTNTVRHLMTKIL